MKDLFNKVLLSNEMIQDGWTSPEKAVSFAAAILLMRPKVSVEIGVYAGKGLVPMGLAHKAINYGIAIGIDPYSVQESVAGQSKDEDREWWAKLDHESVYKKATSNIEKFGVGQYVKLLRQTSAQAEVPDGIGLLRIDGNHGETVIGDTDKWAPACCVGAFLFLDDIHWAGGAVDKAADTLRKTGWKEMYRFDDGLVFQRVR